jgi:predicted lysophospholipase L1 biosynthesis ABC-type transport system permease subunit
VHSAIVNRRRAAHALNAFPAYHAVRLARRELRGGIRGLRVFLACLVLGVTAIAGIGSLAAAEH